MQYLHPDALDCRLTHPHQDIPMRNTPSRLGDFIVIGITLAILMCLLPLHLVRHRSASRSMTCSNNLKQIGLAFHNYHAAYDCLPAGSSGSSSGSEAKPNAGNADRLSGLVGILPFMEHQKLWEKISNRWQGSDRVYPEMGPALWVSPADYKPWGERPEDFVCPDDADAATTNLASHYRLNYGDSIENVGTDIRDDNQRIVVSMRQTHRGLFGRRIRYGFRDALDGLSNTLMVAERVMPTDSVGRVAKNLPREKLILRPEVCRAAASDADTRYWKPAKGMMWADGSLMSTGFQAILPPNSASCTSEQGILEGVMTVSSRHGNGAHVLIADGRVAFISATIDAGSATNSSVGIGEYETGKPARPDSQSPYGLWGALGSRASSEVIDREKAFQPPRATISKDQLAEYAKLPLQTWRAAGGKGAIQARQIDVDEDGMVMLMDQQNKIRRIGLSRFESEDAYRAVRTKRKQQSELLRSFVVDIETALNLLETRQYEKFVQDHVFLRNNGGEKSANDINPIVWELSRQRGHLIALFDLLLARRSVFQDVEIKQIQAGQLKLGRVPGSGVSEMINVSGHWKLHL